MKKIRFISAFIFIIISTVIFSGTVMADEPAYEARIGSTYYKTLEEAFIAAKYPDMFIITLLCDVTDITSTITVSGSCTLDMNGFDIAGSCTVFHVTTGALTLVDLTDNGSSLTSTSGDCTVLSDWFFEQWNVDVVSETGAAVISNGNYCNIYSGTTTGKTYGIYCKDNFRFFGGTVTGGTAYYFSETDNAPFFNGVKTVSEDGRTATVVWYENATAIFLRYLPDNSSSMICFSTLIGAIDYCPNILAEYEVKLTLLHDVDLDKDYFPNVITPDYEGSWTIDLNGHNITGSGSVIDNFCRSNLTIINSSDKPSMIICSSGEVPAIINQGGLTLENVTVSGGSCGVRQTKSTYNVSPVLTLNNASIACENGCGIEYVNGTVNLITGTVSGNPYAASDADGNLWTGHTLGENSGFIINTDTTVTVGIKHTLAVTAGSGGSITTESGGNYVEGAEINLSASPDVGYYFSGWTASGGGTFENTSSASTVYTMPDNASTVTASFAKITYPLTIAACTGGSITTGSGAYYSEGTKVSISASPDAGYYFSDWTSTGGGTFENPGSASTTFTMPGSAATVTAHFSQISSGGGDSDITYYTISASAGKGGSISPSGSVSVACGDSKTYSITASEGYEIEDVLVDGVSVSAVDTYTFENVKKAHIIKAVFEKTQSTIQWKNPYADVTDKSWYYDAVRFVSENGLMIGTSSNAYSPNRGMTRGMFVTVLYRLSGDNRIYTGSFWDVQSGEWYAPSVAWAAQNDIVCGVGDNEFAPDAVITREQLAVILYNYAKYKGYDLSVGEDTNILSCKDARSISEYAYSALQWACGMGILGGDDNGYLNPNGPATRAEVSAIMQRFVENVIR